MPTTAVIVPAGLLTAKMMRSAVWSTGVDVQNKPPHADAFSGTPKNTAAIANNTRPIRCWRDIGKSSTYSEYLILDEMRARKVPAAQVYADFETNAVPA